MTMEPTEFETLEGQGFPTVRQISIFLDNRVGQLLRLTQIMEKKDVRILALSVIDSVDCAIVRLIFDETDRAIDELKNEGFAISVSELIVVRLPLGKRALLTVWSALLSSEINISYAYPLLSDKVGAAIAVRVDNMEIAADTLMAKKFEVLGESELSG